MFTWKNNCRDHYGNSPLHLAAQNGYTQTIKSLLGVHSHILNNKNSDGVSIQIVLVTESLKVTKMAILKPPLIYSTEKVNQW